MKIFDKKEWRHIEVLGSMIELLGQFAEVHILVKAVAAPWMDSGIGKPFLQRHAGGVAITGKVDEYQQTIDLLKASVCFTEESCFSIAIVGIDQSGFQVVIISFRDLVQKTLARITIDIVLTFLCNLHEVGIGHLLELIDRILHRITTLMQHNLSMQGLAEERAQVIETGQRLTIPTAIVLIDIVAATGILTTIDNLLLQ